MFYLVENTNSFPLGPNNWTRIGEHKIYWLRATMSAEATKPRYGRGDDNKHIDGEDCPHYTKPTDCQKTGLRVASGSSNAINGNVHCQFYFTGLVGLVYPVRGMVLINVSVLCVRAYLLLFRKVEFILRVSTLIQTSFQKKKKRSQLKTKPISRQD